MTPQEYRAHARSLVPNERPAWVDERKWGILTTWMQGATLRETGRQHDITPERVRQIVHTILRKARGAPPLPGLTDIQCAYLRGAGVTDAARINAIPDGDLRRILNGNKHAMQKVRALYPYTGDELTNLRSLSGYEQGQREIQRLQALLELHGIPSSPEEQERRMRGVK